MGQLSKFFPTVPTTSVYNIYGHYTPTQCENRMCRTTQQFFCNYSQQGNSRTWMLIIFSTQFSSTSQHSRLYATSPNQPSRVSLDRPAVHLTNEQQDAPSYYATSLLTASYLSRSRTIQESTELALAIPVRKLNDTSCWYFRKWTHKRIPRKIRGILSNTLTCQVESFIF